MTRRILLTLADDTTDTECGKCPHGGNTGFCHPFAADMRLEWGRLPSCLAAERAAAGMVQIRRDDAALGPWTVTGGWTNEHRAAADRIERALEAHGEGE